MPACWFIWGIAPVRSISARSPVVSPGRPRLMAVSYTHLGIYSLSPYTLEEVVSRTYLVKEKPDAILNIIDGTNICLLYTSRCV